MYRLTGMLTAVVLVLGLAAAGASPAMSHTGATGIVKERMDLMKALATAVARIAKIVRASGSLTAENRKAVADSAALVQRHATAMLKMFPKGSGTHPSEALPKVWQDWTGFEAAARRMGTAAAKLAAAAPASDRKDLMIDFVGMARTCGACHTQYRLKKR